MNWEKLILPCLLMTFLANAVVGCSVRERVQIVTPPDALTMPYPRPEVPADLKDGNDIKKFAIAASRYIIDLQEALAIDEAKLTAIREWSLKVKGGVVR